MGSSTSRCHFCGDTNMGRVNARTRIGHRHQPIPVGTVQGRDSLSLSQAFRRDRSGAVSSAMSCARTPTRHSSTSWCSARSTIGCSCPVSRSPPTSPSASSTLSADDTKLTSCARTYNQSKGHTCNARSGVGGWWRGVVNERSEGYADLWGHPPPVVRVRSFWRRRNVRSPTLATRGHWA